MTNAGTFETSRVKDTSRNGGEVIPNRPLSADNDRWRSIVGRGKGPEEGHRHLFRWGSWFPRVGRVRSAPAVQVMQLGNSQEVIHQLSQREVEFGQGTLEGIDPVSNAPRLF